MQTFKNMQNVFPLCNIQKEYLKYFLCSLTGWMKWKNTCCTAQRDWKDQCQFLNFLGPLIRNMSKRKL